MMLRRWAVREHFIYGAYLRMYLPDCLQILHTTPTHNTSRGSSCAFWGKGILTYFWFSTMTYLDVLKHTSFPEQISKTTGPITVISHVHEF